MRALLKNDRVRFWLALAGSSTILILTAYTLVQQDTRLGVNDLPITTAQTIMQSLDNGAEPRDVLPVVQTDLRTDSTVFAVITDATEHVLASSAKLDGQSSLPPAGTFAYTKEHGSDHFTWEPKPGVRLATYITKYGHSPNNGFIVTGQSLKQAEDRISTYGWLALAAWLATIAWVSLVLLIPVATKKR
jgi:hypothetical protein